MSALLPLAEAQARMLRSVQHTPAVERVSLLAATDRVLAQDIIATIDVPAADNSAMDGYAVSSIDQSARKVVAQRIAAGSRGEPLQLGTAARIFTGAPLPPGADAVAMQENCRLQGDAVELLEPVKAGENVRPRGQDVQAGSCLLSRGRVLRPPDIGLLASVGVADVPVFAPVRVAFMSTGDELVEPGEAHDLGEAAVYNSNRYLLASLLARLGVERVDMGIVPDDALATRDALASAASQADCVITSGGVSVGEEDHVKAAVADLGTLDLWKLAIKPGKPLAFGRIGSTPFVGLPGNPTSVFVTFCLVARPFLMKLQGAEAGNLPIIRARAAFDVNRAGTRQDYQRVVVKERDGELVAQRYPNQSSGVLRSVSESNALAVIPPGVTVAQGDRIEVLLLSDLY